MSYGFVWSIKPVSSHPPLSSGAFSWIGGDLPDLVRRLLVHRGYDGGEDTKRFLLPKLSDLDDPFLLGEMRAAIERIFQAVDRRERVCIYGDYDVDGVTSMTILRAVLLAYGVEVSCFIPIRSQEGYGLSEQAIKRCLQENAGNKPDLLITVDCGTCSVDEVETLRNEGIDVIILDHHESGAKGRPRVSALVNPKTEENSPYTYLCSAGVVFKLAHALLKERKIPGFELRDYLDLVAIATVADIVPLVGENRLLVRHGLSRLINSKHIGLKKLTEIVGLGSVPNASLVGFRIGPRINAAGRMDAPQDALDLLLTDCPVEAGELAHLLDTHNKRRQEEEEMIRSEAVEMVNNRPNLEHERVIVLASRTWHPGVVGIVASLIARRYGRPTFVIAIDAQGMGKGSGRSIPGISLVDALQACSAYTVAGGGHEMAAGLSIKEDQIDAFRDAFDRYVHEHADGAQCAPTLEIDEEVTLSELTLDLLESYELLEPFGNGNPQPVFMARNIFLSDAPKRVGNNHLRLSLRQGLVTRDAVFFNAGDIDLPEPPWDIAFTIDRNEFRRRVSISISLQDVRSAQD